jgi:predicted TIM-barrel fold metal-dependent hydrolase
MFDRYPNLMAHLSAGSALLALKRNPVFSREFLEQYSDRLLFGRDYYGGELAKFLDSLNLSLYTDRKIYHENAEKLVDPEARKPTPSVF